MGAVATLTKQGDSWAVIFDQSVLDEFRVAPDTVLDVSMEAGRLVLTPHDPQRREKLDAALKNTMEKYKNVFKRLAEE